MRSDLGAILIFCLATCAASVTDVRAQVSPPVPGMTWDTIKGLPDFGGAWELDFSGGPPAPPRNLRPEVARVLADYNAKMAQGIDPADLSKERPSYCGPPKFVGFNGGLQDYVEFLFTPGRVTITNELGLIRRVTLGEKPPTMTQPTNSGISVGHWEGETLVIESTGFDPDLGMGEPTSKVPIKVGRNLHLIERFTLVGPDRMEVTQRMSAPEIFTAPAENKTFYKRNRDHVMREMSNCVNNRAFDNATGRERFDLTPPPDLPPPPSG